MLQGESDVIESLQQTVSAEFVDCEICGKPAFITHKTPLHMDVELPTLQAMKLFVAMGNGVALVPEMSMEDDLERGELVRIPVRELKLHRKLRLIYRKSASLSHAARAFLTVAESFARERSGRYRFQADK